MKKILILVALLSITTLVFADDQSCLIVSRAEVAHKVIYNFQENKFICYFGDKQRPRQVEIRKEIKSSKSLSGPWRLIQELKYACEQSNKTVCFWKE